MIIKQDYKNKYLVIGGWSQPMQTHAASDRYSEKMVVRIAGNLLFPFLYIDIQLNLNGSKSLGPWKLVRDMGSSSNWGLIMAPVQEVNSDNLG